MIFEMDTKSLKKLSNFFKQSPRQFLQASSNVLTSLAFQTRKNDIRNLSSNLIIRNKRFVESSIIVQKAKPVQLERQIAIVATVKRGSFTGWEEQQKGTQPVRKRAITDYARGGNKRAIAKPYGRLRAATKIYKPEQFAGRDLKSKYMFMMRVLNTRGTSQFLLSHDVQTRRGVLGRGYYKIKNHRIKRLQTFNNTMRPNRLQFRTMSLNQLRYSTDIKKVWQTSLNHIVNKYK